MAMAAEVSSLHRVLSAYNKDDITVGKESGGPKSRALITRDLLGGGGGPAGDGGSSALFNIKSDHSKELDLDLQVPNGWEKRLDLKSGKVYIQRCNSSSNSSSSSGDGNYNNKTVASKLPHDLNIPPSSSKQLLNLLDDDNTNLDLKLASSSSSSSPLPSSSFTNYQNQSQSVCTLDKVKFALERAEKLHYPLALKEKMMKKRTSPCYSSSTSSSNYSIKEQQQHDQCDLSDQEPLLLGSSSAAPVAAGCPGCLSYVLIMKHNPKCPRCNSLVPLPSTMTKRPRFDLNLSI